jgi:hypothetical protein
MPMPTTATHVDHVKLLLRIIVLHRLIDELALGILEIIVRRVVLLLEQQRRVNRDLKRRIHVRRARRPGRRRRVLSALDGRRFYAFFSRLRWVELMGAI